MLDLLSKISFSGPVPTDSIDQLEALKVLNFLKNWSLKVTLENVI